MSNILYKFLTVKGVFCNYERSVSGLRDILVEVVNVTQYLSNDGNFLTNISYLNSLIDPDFILRF